MCTCVCRLQVPGPPGSTQGLWPPQALSQPPPPMPSTHLQPHLPAGYCVLWEALLDDLWPGPVTRCKPTTGMTAALAEQLGAPRARALERVAPQTLWGLSRGLHCAARLAPGHPVCQPSTCCFRPPALLPFTQRAHTHAHTHTPLFVAQGKYLGPPHRAILCFTLFIFRQGPLRCPSWPGTFHPPTSAS